MTSQRKVGFLAFDAVNALGLRTLRETDQAAMWTGWQDPEVQKSWREGEQAQNTLEDVQAFIFFSRGQGQTKRDLVIDWQGQFVGMFSWQDGAGIWSANTEISYWMLPAWRKKGLGSAAVNLGLNYLFSKRQVHRVSALVSADNIGSMRLLASVGMRREACLTQALRIQKQYQDAVIFRLLRQEFASTQ